MDDGQQHWLGYRVMDIHYSDGSGSSSFFGLDMRMLGAI